MILIARASAWRTMNGFIIISWCFAHKIYIIKIHTNQMQIAKIVSVTKTLYLRISTYFCIFCSLHRWIFFFHFSFASKRYVVIVRGYCTSHSTRTFEFFCMCWNFYNFPLGPRSFFFLDYDEDLWKRISLVLLWLAVVIIWIRVDTYNIIFYALSF